MNYSVIKSASIYRAELPSMADMREHLAELTFTPITESQVSCAGFIPNAITNELVTQLPGVGYSFVLRYDTKLIPAKVVNRKYKEAIRAGVNLTGEDRKLIKASIFAEMCATAEYDTTLIHVLYDAPNQLMVINSTTKRHLKVALSMLVNCVGSIKTQTIHIDNIKMGISLRLKDYLTDSAERPQALAPFTPLEFAKLRAADTTEERVTFSGIDLAGERSSELISLLDNGYQVEELELNHMAVSFKLASDFSLRAIRFPLFELTEDDGDNNAEAWCHVNASDLIMLSKAISDLCDMMGYQAPAAAAA